MYMKHRQGQQKGFEDQGSRGEPSRIGLASAKRSEMLPETEERERAWWIPLPQSLAIGENRS